MQVKKTNCFKQTDLRVIIITVVFLFSLILMSKLGDVISYFFAPELLRIDLSIWEYLERLEIFMRTDWLEIRAMVIACRMSCQISLLIIFVFCLKRFGRQD